MTAKEILNWLQTLTEEELECDVFAGAPDANGEYMPVEKLSVVGADYGAKAVFMEPLAPGEEDDEEAAAHADEDKETVE